MDEVLGLLKLLFSRHSLITRNLCDCEFNLNTIALRTLKKTLFTALPLTLAEDVGIRLALHSCTEKIFLHWKWWCRHLLHFVK